MTSETRAQCRPRVTSGRRRVRRTEPVPVPVPVPVPMDGPVVGWVGRVSRRRPPRWVSAMLGSALTLAGAVVL